MPQRREQRAQPPLQQQSQRTKWRRQGRQQERQRRRQRPQQWKKAAPRTESARLESCPHCSPGCLPVAAPCPTRLSAHPPRVPRSASALAAGPFAPRPASTAWLPWRARSCCSSGPLSKPPSCSARRWCCRECYCPRCHRRPHRPPSRPYRSCRHCHPQRPQPWRQQPPLRPPPARQLVSAFDAPAFARPPTTRRRPPCPRP